MTIWHEMAEQRLLQYGCVLDNGEVKHSSFPSEYRKHLAVARQSLIYIFKNVGKHADGYDEAHMEVGDTHFSGYLIDENRILVCLCAAETNQHDVRAFIESNKQRFSS